MKIKVIYHSRKKFYHGKDIYWYEFECSGITDVDKQMEFNKAIPPKFLRLPSSIYWEYGGSHLEAIADLTDSQLYDIVEGNEI